MIGRDEKRGKTYFKYSDVISSQSIGIEYSTVYVDAWRGPDCFEANAVVVKADRITKVVSSGLGRNHNFRKGRKFSRSSLATCRCFSIKWEYPIVTVANFFNVYGMKMKSFVCTPKRRVALIKKVKLRYQQINLCRKTYEFWKQLMVPLTEVSCIARQKIFLENWYSLAKSIQKQHF